MLQICLVGAAAGAAGHGRKGAVVYQCCAQVFAGGCDDPYGEGHDRGAGESGLADARATFHGLKHKRNYRWTRVTMGGLTRAYTGGL
jgi:hypothetical protein